MSSLQGRGASAALRFSLGSAPASEAVATHLVALADAGKLPQVRFLSLQGWQDGQWNVLRTSCLLGWHQSSHHGGSFFFGLNPQLVLLDRAS